MSRHQSAPTSPVNEGPAGGGDNFRQQRPSGFFANFINNNNGSRNSQANTSNQRRGSRPRNFFDGIWRNISSSTTDMLNSKTFNLDGLGGLNKKMSKSCSSCGLSLSTISIKRKRCSLCSHFYCSTCMEGVRCGRCTVFRSGIPLNRDLLNTLKVRDLKWYLSSQSVSSETFCEKRELIDLILLTGQQRDRRASQQQPQPQSPESSTPTTSSASASANSSSTSSPSRCPNVSLYLEPDQVTEEMSIGEPASDIENLENRSESRQQPTIYSSVSNLAASVKIAGTDLSGSQQNLSTFNMNDIKKVEEIPNLSVRQLKLLLARNYVDFKGCLEREELVTKVSLLWQDKQANKAKEILSETTMSDDGICKICMVAAIDCVLLECGHLVTCTVCGKNMTECPVCRQFVSRVVHVFKT